MRPTVFIGHDHRERLAYSVCVASLRRYSPDVIVQPVSRQFLGAMYKRPTEVRSGKLWDVISDAPMATDFSLARFWVPVLQKKGLALFCDVDFMWRAPVEEVFAQFDGRSAVQVVKHAPMNSTGIKMDGQVQTDYACKNWSSLMLFDCDRVNSGNFGNKGDENDFDMLHWCQNVPGLFLHQFEWAGCERSLVGDLTPEWNWLEGYSDPAIKPKAVHFTRGTPDMAGYTDVPYADEWREYARRSPE